MPKSSTAKTRVLFGRIECRRELRSNFTALALSFFPLVSPAATGPLERWPDGWEEGLWESIAWQQVEI